MSRSSASMFALGLLMLSGAACRALKGQCSKRTDTLCLQLSLADATQLPDAVSLSITTDRDSSSAPTKDVARPDIVETLQKRPYIVEIELGTQPPENLYLDATATLRSAFATAMNAAYVVGNAGVVYAYSGAWSSLTASPLSATNRVGVWSDGAGGIWIIGQGTVSIPGGIFRY